MSRRIAYWALPPLLCLAIYWDSLQTWFLMDDFSFLGMLPAVRGWRGVASAMFTPTIHGTFRPLSERGFFLLFQWLFGLDALPFRLLAFATQFANLALLASVTGRLTGSRAAGLLAAVFWISNAAMSTAMSWTSAYMQVLCAFCLLLALRCLMWYVDTGKLRYALWQWVVFLAGFGVMESNLMYPALAASFTLLFARKYFRGALALFIPSALFAILHMTLVRKQASGPYAMHFDLSMAQALGTYWSWALEAGRIPAAWAVISAALAGFSAWRSWRRDWIPLFCLVWFASLLAPVLPLSQHLSSYYLTLALPGLAMLGAWAVVCAWGAATPWRAVAAVLAVGYAAGAGMQARREAAFMRKHAGAAQNLVLGVQAAAALHPGKTILLSGVDSTLFWECLMHHPFRALGNLDVRLVPGADAHIEKHPEMGDPREFVLPASVTRTGLKREKIVVYQAGTHPLRNITREYEQSALPLLSENLPSRVDVASRQFDNLLGEGWFPATGTGRWMGKKASLRMAAPQSSPAQLHWSGFCPALCFEEGPLTFTVRVNGAGERRFRIDQSRFEGALELPASLSGKPALDVALEVDRTLTEPGSTRQLGLVFGVFEVK